MEPSCGMSRVSWARRPLAPDGSSPSQTNSHATTEQGIRPSRAAGGEDGAGPEFLLAILDLGRAVKGS